MELSKNSRKTKYRPPGKHEKWWNRHDRICGGKFIMIEDIKQDVSIGKSDRYNLRKNRKRKLNERDDEMVISTTSNRKPSNKKRENWKTDHNASASWICPQCTFINKRSNIKCEICNMDKIVMILDECNKNDSDIEILNFN